MHLLRDIISDIVMRKSSKPKRKSQTRKDQADWKAIGRRVRELRGFDLTQEQFAERLGISQNYLSVMEQGQVRFGVDILLRISRETGRSMEWIVTGKDR